MMKKRSRLPNGISDYRTMMEEDYIYIDKTKYIETLENTHSYVFFLRPRRFGKSLFTSVLEYYYGINYADEFERLFGKTYLGQHPTKFKNSYYILKFGFTGLKTDTTDGLLASFRDSINNSFQLFCIKYHVDLDYTKEGEPAAILNSFLTQFKRHIDGKLYVIIDEYDHFANELLSFQTGLFSDIVTKTGFVRKWYEKIKDGTSDGTIGRFFATGVSPITLDSLTSGFNIAIDYTRFETFNEMMGFTEEEVRFLISETLGDVSADEMEQIVEEMRKCYDGYLFNPHSNERLFNSNMSLNYLSAYLQTRRPPDNLLDASIASDYSKIGKMFALKNKSSNYEVLQEIIEGKEQTAFMTAQYSLEKRFDKNDFMSLLFYLGYLTIDSSYAGMVKLRVPNYVVKELYFSYFEMLLEEEFKYELDVSNVQTALTILALEGDNTNLIACIETVLSGMSNRDSIKTFRRTQVRGTFLMDEKYVKTICFTLCMLSKCYVVESENEVNKGYSDIQLLKRPGIDVNFYAMIEFKYLSKADDKEENISRKLEAAKKQLGRYNDSPKFKGMNNLKKWAVVFVGDKCVRNEELL